MIRQDKFKVGDRVRLLPKGSFLFRGWPERSFTVTAVHETPSEEQAQLAMHTQWITVDFRNKDDASELSGFWFSKESENVQS
jgi:hypothetical protein